MSEAELAAFSPEEQGFLRRAERDIIVPSKNQLEELNAGCQSKPQYAKTYRVLRRDKRTTLDSMNQEETSPLHQAMMRMYDRVISYKLDRMATFFRRRWNDDIESWAGVEGGKLDKSGCVVLVAGFLLAGPLCVVMILALS